MAITAITAGLFVFGGLSVAFLAGRLALHATPGFWAWKRWIAAGRPSELMGDDVAAFKCWKELDQPITGAGLGLWKAIVRDREAQGAKLALAEKLASDLSLEVAVLNADLLCERCLAAQGEVRSWSQSFSEDGTWETRVERRAPALLGADSETSTALPAGYIWQGENGSTIGLSGILPPPMPW